MKKGFSANCSRRLLQVEFTVKADFDSLLELVLEKGTRCNHMNDEIICRTHGKQPGANVCQHIVQGFIERKRVSFCWPESSTDLYPDAWCHWCDVRQAACGNEWTGEALDQLQPKVVCSECYKAMKTFHMGGNPWS